MSNRLPQPLRKRISSLAQEIIAYHWVEGLNHNRLTGAIYNVILAPENAGLSEQQAVDLAVDLTQRDRIDELLARYDQVDARKKKMAERQIEGIVRNNIDPATPNHDQVIEDTLAMLKRFPLVRSITAVQRLVKARIANGHRDIAEEDEDKYSYD